MARRKRPNWDASELATILIDYDDAADDLLSSNYSTFDSNLKRLLHLLDNDRYLSYVESTLLPQVDFDDWYDNAKSTVKGMVGSGDLEWPLDPNESLSMRMQLLRAIDEGTDDVPNFCSKFMYAGSHLDDCVYEFGTQILEPTFRDFRKLVVRTFKETTNGERSSKSLVRAQSWHERPIGKIIIGLIITIVGGSIVAWLSGLI